MPKKKKKDYIKIISITHNTFSTYGSTFLNTSSKEVTSHQNPSPNYHAYHFAGHSARYAFEYYSRSSAILIFYYV